MQRTRGVACTREDEDAARNAASTSLSTANRSKIEELIARSVGGSPAQRESGLEPSSEKLLLGRSLENQARNEGKQSSQGRALLPTFEKPREERAYELEVSLSARMCQLFCMRNADCLPPVPPRKPGQRLWGSGVFSNG